VSKIKKLIITLRGGDMADRIFVLRDPRPNIFRIPVDWVPSGIEEKISKIEGIKEVTFAGGNIMVTKEPNYRLGDLIPLIQELFN